MAFRRNAAAKAFPRSSSLLPLLLLLALFLLLLAASSLLSSLNPNLFPLLSSASFSFPRPAPLSPPPPSLRSRSFVSSLELFLTERRMILPSSPKSALPAADGKMDGQGEDEGEPEGSFDVSLSAKDLDNAVGRRELNDLYAERKTENRLRVFVYDMPSKFTFDLLQLFHDTLKDTENSTSNGSPIHRLIEQHSIDYWLWADLLAPESERLVKTVVRVFDEAEADIFYIPFFTTISFFLLEKPERSRLYREALKWVTSQPAWQRSGGRDHVLPVHHPWSFKSHRRFMKHAIWLLPDLDSTGNWYKPGEVSLEKDVILPYVPNVEVCDANCLEYYRMHRTTLLFFRGRTKRNAGGKIRSKLINILKGEPNMVLEEGSAGNIGREAAQEGMRRSKYCLSPAGDTPSSARLFDAIVSGCIPVVVSDELEFPFEGILDYRKIVIFVSSLQALEPGWLVSHLHNISSFQVSEIQAQLAMFSKHFQYGHPAEPLGPEDLTWRMIAGKVPFINLHIRRNQRVVEGSRTLCTCDCRHRNQTQGTPL